MSTRVLKLAAVAFAGIALIAGGLQSWAFVVGGGPRHLVLAIFAGSVGVSVLVAVIGSNTGSNAQ